MAEDPARDRKRLLDMRRAVDAIERYVGVDEDDFLADDLCQDAIAWRLKILGEAAGRVSRACQTRHPEIPWVSIVDQRHLIIHEHDRAVGPILWRIAREDVPPLAEALRQGLARERGER